jgi:hypothetical protein
MRRAPVDMSSRSSRPRSAPLSKGLYANYFEVGHTAFEVVLDFGQRYGRRRSRCHTRIVTSPLYAEALLRTLEGALVEYRARFGKTG